MPQISSYPYDVVVQDQDAWIGTDAITRQTKQYTASAVATYLNIKGKISISAQMIFNLADAGTPANGQFTGPANGVPIAPTTTLEVSPLDVSGANTVAFMTYLVGNDIL